MTTRHGAHPHAPTPRQLPRTNTCSVCGCTWKLDDLSAPNPKEDLCSEPVKWHPHKCLCHSQPYVDGMLDERDRMAEERLMEIRLHEIAAGAPTLADKLNG